MTFLKFILFITFLFFSLTTIFGQGKEDTHYRIFKIRETCQQINHYKIYDSVVIDDPEEFLGQGTDNGGSLIGYFKSDSLKKILEWVGLSNKVIQNEYYYNNDKLIFVYSTESRYRFNDSAQSLNYAKLDKIFEGRYYFDKDKLIDSILNDKEHAASKKKDSAQLLASSNEYRKLLKKKRK